MLEFRSTRVVPPGGRYFYEVAGTLLQDLTMSGLLRIIRAFSESRKLSVPDDLEAAVEDYMCRRLPEGFCRGTLDGRERYKVITIDGVRKATMALAAGNPRVTLGEARRRAEICSQCGQNDQTMCPSCVGLVTWARRMVGQSLGAVEEWLGVCLVDQVALSAKIHMKNIPEHDGYPDNCWRAIV